LVLRDANTSKKLDQSLAEFSKSDENSKEKKYFDEIDKHINICILLENMSGL
jgi:hypothetical protein